MRLIKRIFGKVNHLIIYFIRSRFVNSVCDTSRHAFFRIAVDEILSLLLPTSLLLGLVPLGLVSEAKATEVPTAEGTSPAPEEEKPETKAIVDNLIRDTLWAELPESYDEISITTYRKEIYEYIYLRYKTAA